MHRGLHETNDRKLSSSRCQLPKRQNDRTERSPVKSVTRSRRDVMCQSRIQAATGARVPMGVRGFFFGSFNSGNQVSFTVTDFGRRNQVFRTREKYSDTQNRNSVRGQQREIRDCVTSGERKNGEGTRTLKRNSLFSPLRELRRKGEHSEPKTVAKRRARVTKSREPSGQPVLLEGF